MRQWKTLQENTAMIAGEINKIMRIYESKIIMLEFWKEYSDKIKRIVKNTAKSANKNLQCHL